MVNLLGFSVQSANAGEPYREGDMYLLYGIIKTQENHYERKK